MDKILIKDNMKKIVIKLGGSMFGKPCDEFIDFQYLSRFRKVVYQFTNNKNKVFIITGGGPIVRRLQFLCKQNGIDENIDLHKIGTAYNNVNAEIVRAFMGDKCEDEIISNEKYYINSKLEFKKNIIVGGAGRPGHSGDVDAILMAKRIQADVVFSLKNVDGVYTDDPKKNPDATLVSDLTWNEYFKIIGYKEEHEPGGNYPVDPIAAKMAKNLNLKFIILDGHNLENFENAVLNKNFSGSTISNSINS